MTQVLVSERELYNTLINDWSKLPQFIDYFLNQCEEARTEIPLRGRLEDHSRTLPVFTEQRFSQLQILNAVIEYFEIEQKKERSTLYRKYLENYQRQLSSRDIEAYINGEQTVVSLSMIINEISLVRNKYIGIIKGLEGKSFSINNIVKLRTAGLEDSRIE